MSRLSPYTDLRTLCLHKHILNTIRGGLRIFFRNFTEYNILVHSQPTRRRKMETKRSVAPCHGRIPFFIVVDNSIRRCQQTKAEYCTAQVYSRARSSIPHKAACSHGPLFWCTRASVQRYQCILHRTCCGLSTLQSWLHTHRKPS